MSFEYTAAALLVRVPSYRERQGGKNTEASLFEGIEVDEEDAKDDDEGAGEGDDGEGDADEDL